jgi:hypothetical protein
MLAKWPYRVVMLPLCRRATTLPYAALVRVLMTVPVAAATTGPALGIPIVARVTVGRIRSPFRRSTCPGHRGGWGALGRPGLVVEPLPLAEEVFAVVIADIDDPGCITDIWVMCGA